MKTPTQIINYLVEIPIRIENGSLTVEESMEKSLKIMYDFEKQIRKDQERITIEAAVEKLIDADKFVSHFGEYSIELSEAIEEAKNTKTIED